MPQHHGTKSQLGIQVYVQLGLGDGHRHGCRRPGQHLYPLCHQLHPARGPGLLPKPPSHDHSRLFRDLRHVHPLPTGALQKPVPLAQFQKGEAASHRPLGVYHAGDLNGLIPVGTSYDVFEFQPLRLSHAFQEFHNRSRPF